MSLKEKWSKSWNFEKKMNMVIFGTIAVIAMAAIVISTSSFVLAVTKQNRDYVTEQLSVMAGDYADNLEQYKALTTAIVLDSHVQSYCTSKEAARTYTERGEVYSVFANLLNIQPNVNFITVTNKEIENYVYNGNTNISESAFETACAKDYEQSFLAKESGTLRVSFSNLYHRDGRYTLTLYFPAYSVMKLDEINGNVIVNLDDNLLTRFHQKNISYSNNLYLTDITGRIVSTQDMERIGETMEYSDEISGAQGWFWHGGKLISYQRVVDWNFYIINEVSALSLYRNCIGTIVLILVITLIATGLALAMARNLSKSLFRPINKIINKMGDVSKGNLRTRIYEEDMDSDGKKLAIGFNIMMDEIDLLMERVKEEQRQLDMMKFNALQSQIKPHFLYNTLECIHWQALSEGNTEVSTMVKALAQYYRICLSEGKDIIVLRKEIEHIKNYLVIQNMRYDNIINLHIGIPEKYLDVEIPKLTLQPLIENSIYHGIRIKEGRKGTIEISVSEEQNGIYIRVSDDGMGMSEEELEYINSHISDTEFDAGYGIANVNKRIELLFGEEYGLLFHANKEHGVCVEIRLPNNLEKGGVYEI